MKTLANLKMRSKIFITAIVVILLLAAALTSYSIISGTQNTKRDIASFRNEELAKRKQNLKSYVDIAHETILFNYEKSLDVGYLEDRYGTRLKSIVDVAESIIRSYMEQIQLGNDTIQDAQEQAIEDVEHMR